MRGAAAEFIGGLVASGYFFPLLLGTYLATGAALLAGRFVPLALIVLAPVMVNIMAIHLFVDPSGLPLTIVVVALEVFLAWSYRATFRPLLRAWRWRAGSKPVELNENTMIGSKSYAKLKYREVKGRRMAYIDEGVGDAIAFQHGQPASSYIWRNVMPYLEGMGRLIACDLIGMGESEKLNSSDPNRYNYFAHRDFLFALWDALDLRRPRGARAGRLGRRTRV
jgi:hypothetical protein